VELDAPPARLAEVELVQVAEIELDPLQARIAQPYPAHLAVREGRLADARRGEVGAAQIALLDHRLQPIAAGAIERGQRTLGDLVAVEAAGIAQPGLDELRLVRHEFHRASSPLPGGIAPAQVLQT
jgi:hypothetical protein